MYRVVICDDEAEQLNSVAAMVEEFAQTCESEDFSIQKFSATSALLDDFYSTGPADIYILDIYIDGLSGIEAAKEIRKKDSRCRIIFISYSDTHAVDAFSVRATHYLEKPVAKEDVFEAMNRCVENLHSHTPQKKLILKVVGGTISVLYSEILYVESARQCQYIVTKNQKYKTRKSMREWFGFLQEDPAFIMPHRSYIINLLHVQSIASEAIVLKDGTALPLPRGERKQVLEQFLDYSFKSAGLPGNV